MSFSKICMKRLPSAQMESKKCKIGSALWIIRTISTYFNVKNKFVNLSNQSKKSSFLKIDSNIVLWEMWGIIWLSIWNMFGYVLLPKRSVPDSESHRSRKLFDCGLAFPRSNDDPSSLETIFRCLFLFKVSEVSYIFQSITLFIDKKSKGLLFFTLKSFSSPFSKNLKILILALV